MVWIDPAFEAPTIPENERYQGVELDGNIVKALPEGVTIKWISTYKASFWAISSKVDVTLPSGQEKSYFAKVYHAPRALDIACAEFQSTTQLREAIPDNVPVPVGYGLCAGNSSRSFFIAEFRDMKGGKIPENSDHIRTYSQIAKPTEPKQPTEEEDDLHALYAMRNDLATSICWPENKQIRHLAMEEMKRLVGKYSGGYQEYISKKALEPRLTDRGEASNARVESKP